MQKLKKFDKKVKGNYSTINKSKMSIKLCKYISVLLYTSVCCLAELRKAVRTSTWRKDLSKHEHTFPKEGEEGGETYNEETDTWTKTCKECGYQVSFEKM